MLNLKQSISCLL